VAVDRRTLAVRNEIVEDDQQAPEDSLTISTRSSFFTAAGRRWLHAPVGLGSVREYLKREGFLEVNCE
jgi:hypothetical protein